MGCCFRFVLVDEPLPGGGSVLLRDGSDGVHVLIDRRALTEDPDGVMLALSSHCNALAESQGWSALGIAG